MTYKDWEESVPDVIKADVLWTVTAYRLAVFLTDMMWRDVKNLSKEICTRSLSDQLYRSGGSICANIEEGYSKMSSKDRARFYEYSLGSARETRGWYYRARHVLGESVANHRMGILTEIIRLLLVMVQNQRSDAVCEDGDAYRVEKWKEEDVPFAIEEGSE